MSELVQIIDSLENKISKLLHKMELMHQANNRLQEEMQSLREEHEKSSEIVSAWEEKYNSLKLANSMLGSNVDKTEAKLRINALIRELDQCITQLSE